MACMSAQKQLLIMRHAKSSWADRSMRDFDRPLNGRGKRAAPRMASWLEENGAVPELIISSAANRAQSTAKLLTENFQEEVRVEIVEEFYLASPIVYLEMLALSLIHI